MPLSRRRFLYSSAAAVAITAFIPARRSWASGASLPAGAVPVPPLDGELVLDGELLDDAASDFGRIVSRQPYAVLRPGSVEDVRRMVLFARRQGVKIGGMGMVGNSHSTFGQAQVEAGVVVDMSSLAEIHQVGPDSAWVDAGVRWVDLVRVTAPQGLAPPTLTDYLDLSIGGTLSVGGIGGQTFRSGLQVDNVLELEVITGRGRRVTCSPTRHRFLFDSVRAGLGQFAIIVRARVRLVEVPPLTRTYTALYADLSTFTADQETLVADGRFDYVEGQAVAADGGGWNYLLEAVEYFAPGDEPDDAALLAGLSFLPATLATEDRTYFDFADRLQPIVELLRQLGLWQLPHPWFDMFVPGPAAESFIGAVLDTETAATLGPAGVILIYPNRLSKVTAPFLALPDTETFYLFSLLRTAAPGTDPAELVERNRGIYEALAALGGKRYAISSVPFSQQDWRDNFGPAWPRFRLAKLLFDPANVLTPGQGIFTF